MKSSGKRAKESGTSPSASVAVKLSGRETAARSLLKVKKPTATSEFKSAIFGSNDGWPFHHTIIAAGVLRGLRRKMDINGDRYTVVSENRGRGGTTWWLERR